MKERLIKKMVRSGLGRRIVYAFHDLNRYPVFLLGNQKSGTTAITALLGMLTGESYADYLRGFSQNVLESIQNGAISLEKAIRTRAKVEFSKKIIKESNLTLFYPQLRKLYPDAKMVFIVRDPRDNIRSILNFVNLPADASGYRLSGLDMQTEWEHVLDNRWLSLPYGSLVQSLAMRWNKMAGIYRKFEKDFVLIRYEDFLQDKVGNIEQLACQLQLKPQGDISQWVDHHFQPPGNRSISWKDFFGEERLALINELCQDAIRFFDYPL